MTLVDNATPDGLSEQFRPRGVEDSVRPTVPEKLFTAETVIVEDPVAPATTPTELGLAESSKSAVDPEEVTTTITLTV